MDELVGSLEDLSAAKIRSRMEDIRSNLSDAVQRLNEMTEGEATEGEVLTGGLVAGISMSAFDPGGLFSSISLAREEDRQELEGVGLEIEAYQEALGQLRDQLLELSGSGGAEEQAVDAARDHADAVDKLLGRLEGGLNELKSSERELLRRKLV